MHAEAQQMPSKVARPLAAAMGELPYPFKRNQRFMTSVRQRAKQDRTRRILDAARQLICETERADFTMRAVADRAQVDLVTIYNLIGPKTAILHALLHEDIERFTAALAENRADDLTILFDAIALLRQHYGEEEQYFRSVVLAVYVHGESDQPSQFRGPRWTLWSGLVRKVADTGHLEDGISLPVFAGHLASIVFAHVLEWAAGDISLAEMEMRTRYGFALALQSVGRPASRDVLRAVFDDAQAHLGASLHRTSRAADE